MRVRHLLQSRNKGGQILKAEYVSQGIVLPERGIIIVQSRSAGLRNKPAPQVCSLWITGTVLTKV